MKGRKVVIMAGSKFCAGGNNRGVMRIYTLAAGPRAMVFGNSVKMSKCGWEPGVGNQGSGVGSRGTKARVCIGCINCITTSALKMA